MKTTENNPMGNKHKPTGLTHVSMELLPLIMNNIPQAVFWKDRDLVYLGCNQAFADDAGFSSPEEVVGKSDFDMPWKAQAELYRADDTLVMETGQSKINYEESQTTPNGSIIWLSTSKIPVRDDGQVVAVLGMYEDVTARKQAEVAVRESEERFRRFTEATVEGLVFHENGKIVDVNPAALSTFGLSEHQEIIGRNLLDFIVIESHETVMQQMQLETVLPYEIQCIRNDGTVFPVETSTRAYKAGDKTIRASSIRDITERKRANQALRENQQLLQLVMDNIPQSVFWKDTNLTYLGANQSFADDAGFASPQQMVGRNDFDMPWKEQAELYRADDQRVLNLGETKLNYEEPQTGPTGQVTWLRTSKIPMRDTNGNVFAVLGMYEDITEQKRLQQQVQEAFERRGYQVQLSTEVSQEIAAVTETNDLFERVVKLTRERFGYYHTQLLRYDPAQDAVVLINGYGETGQKMLASGHKMPLGEGLIGTAAATGETVMRPTLADDPDWHPHPLLPNTKGEIAVPIKWQDHVLGVLDVQADKAGVLTEDDRLLLEGLCGQIAIAIHSAELVEIVRHNEARLAEALATAHLANWEYDVEKDLFTFNDQFYSIFHTTAEKVGGYQLSSARYAELFVHPADMEVVGVEIGKALSSTERLYKSSIDHRILYADGGIGYITVQLTVERDENGKITRYYGANQDITEQHKAQEEMAERLEEINRLYRSMSQEGWKTYRETAELPKGFMFDQISVKPVDETALDSQSFASIPMKVLGGEVVGNLSVADDPARPMSEEDLSFLQQASDQIALALEGARLAAQTQFALAQSEKLFDASRRLTETKDLQDLTAAAVESINIPIINRAILCTLNYDTQGNVESMDVIANWWNGTGFQATAIGTHYPLEIVRMMKMFVSPTPLFFDDALTDERVDPVTLGLVKRLNLRAVAVLPLHVGTSQLGLLMLEGEESHNFTQEETRLFSALGPQIATVLDNRRQFERAQKQAERESRLNVISQKIQGATTVEAVLQIAARELGHTLGAPLTIAQLGLKETSNGN